MLPAYECSPHVCPLLGCLDGSVPVGPHTESRATHGDESTDVPRQVSPALTASQAYNHSELFPCYDRREGNRE
jgi:hypothetical protein